MTLSHLGTTVRTGEVCSKVIGQFAFFRMIVQICRNTSRCKQRTRHGGGSPVSISANMAGFVHVVHIAHDGISPSVCETQKETTSQPTVACASCRFHVGDIAPAIFRRTRQTLWRAVQMLTQKLCCQTIHDCPKVVPLHYESEWQ